MVYTSSCREKDPIRMDEVHFDEMDEVHGDEDHEVNGNQDDFMLDLKPYDEPYRGDIQMQLGYSDQCESFHFKSEVEVLKVEEMIDSRKNYIKIFHEESYESNAAEVKVVADHIIQDGRNFLLKYIDSLDLHETQKIKHENNYYNQWKTIYHKPKKKNIKGGTSKKVSLHLRSSF